MFFLKRSLSFRTNVQFIHELKDLEGNDTQFLRSEKRKSKIETTWFSMRSKA